MKSMNVLVSSNEKFLKPLLVALTSLHENTTSEDIQVYFINVSLGENRVRWLKRKLAKYSKFTLHCINVDVKAFDGTKLFGHFSVEIYSRLLLMKLLPKDIDRILWLDADTVVHNSIDPFYYMDIDGYSLVACASINQNIGELRQKLRMGEQQRYFNSGILLFNMTFLREHFAENALMEYAYAHMDDIKWPDQDVLNAVCGPTALIIDHFQYNYMHFSEAQITEEELLRIKQENCILHYIGPKKPWSFRFRAKTYAFWREYAKKSGGYTSAFFWRRQILKTAQKLWHFAKRDVHSRMGG